MTPGTRQYSRDRRHSHHPREFLPALHELAGGLGARFGQFLSVFYIDDLVICD